MYARVCYSMLLVSARGLGRYVSIRATVVLPRSRRLTIRLGAALLLAIEKLLPAMVHRQLLLTSALMGMLDVVLDEAAPSAEAAALGLGALIIPNEPESLLPAERVIATLAHAARQGETAWQTEYWERVLQPAVNDYCCAEALAVKGLPDSTGTGHRWAGIEAAIKGMWYVAGPNMGLQPAERCRRLRTESMESRTTLDRGCIPTDADDR